MVPMTTLERILRATVIGSIFLLPFICLIVATWMFFPYITGKNFAFRVLVEIMGFSWIALALINKEYRPSRSWIFAAFAAFVVIIAAADIQGVYPFKSLWSNFERMDGWITIAHTFVYLIVAACVMKARILWKRLWYVSLAVSLFATYYGFLQIAGTLAFGEGRGSGLLTRIDATFGNPIYLAAYMLFHIFIAMWLIAEEGRTKWTPGERAVAAIGIGGLLLSIITSIGSGSIGIPLLLSVIAEVLVIGLGYLERWYLLSFVAAVDTVALLLTGTRGTIIGLVLGAIFAGILYAFTTEGAQKARRNLAIGLAVFVMAVGVFWVERDSSFVHSVGFLERIASISLQDNTVKSRFINWGVAWKGVQERPILGWGQENFAIVFDKYYDPRMFNQEQWFDRVHNIVFDWLVAGGFLGLISYLSIFAAALWVLWRKSVFDSAERSIFTGLLAAYFCHNFFVFDNVTSYILFGTVLAYIVSRVDAANHSRPLLDFPTVSKSIAPALAGVLAVAAVGCVWFVNEPAYAANVTLIDAINVNRDGIQNNLASFKKSISYGAFGTQEAREQLIQIATQLASANVSNDIKEQFATTAFAEMEKQSQASPLDARFPLFTGILLGTYGQNEQAAQALQRAHDLSPNKQTILFQQAAAAQSMGKDKDAFEFTKTAYELDHDYVDARIYYAAMAIRIGQEALADELLAPIRGTGLVADQKIASAYAARNEYAKIIPLWEEKINSGTTDIQSYFTLASAYYIIGKKDKSIQTLRASEAVNPAVTAQAESLIDQIKKGTLKTK